MPTTRNADRKSLPHRFEDLVQRMPPQAIAADAHYENTVETIDALMAACRLTPGQALYLETLVQLCPIPPRVTQSTLRGATKIKTANYDRLARSGATGASQ